MALRIYYFLIAFGMISIHSVSQNTFPASGNAGIGTTSPDQLLTLNAATGANSLVSFKQSSATNAYVGLGMDGVFRNQTLSNIQLQLRADGASNFITFYTNSAERFRIDASGKIGIGTTNPQFKVDINSLDNEGATRLRLANITSSGANAPGSFPTIEVLGARGDGNTSFEGRLALGTRRTDGSALSNQTLGAVLFGGQYGTQTTFQPSQVLYPASIQGIAEGNFTNSTAMPTAIVFMSGSTGNDIASANLSYGTERMRITSAGNIGIGTSNPGPYKLAVEGTVAARKIKVTQATPWADYVFNEDYELWTIEQVEKYIKEHKHLPEVPTAKEVEKEGIDLGENQTLLLKKLEELTLYVIDQNKQINDQQKQIIRQQTQIDELKKLIVQTWFINK